MKSNSDAHREDEWIGNLVHEAARDLVFLWNITSGSFGGPSLSGSIPMVLQKKAITALLEVGCKVGFGNPDSPDWHVPHEIQSEGKTNATKIIAMLSSQPEDYKFLVFALRSSDAQQSADAQPVVPADRLWRPLN